MVVLRRGIQHLRGQKQKGYQIVINVSLQDLLVGGEDQCSIGMFEANTGSVTWLTEEDELPEECPCFRVSKVGRKVRVELVSEFIHGFPLGYAMEMDNHDPWKVVMLAGMVINTARTCFEPMGVTAPARYC